MNDFEASALRFRPQLFTQLVGQEFVVRTLTAEILDGRISHAYLFSGPRGVGKTSAARLLAQAINYPQLLESSDGGVAIDKLDSQWQAIRRGNSVDVIEIDGASHTSVQDVRQIREEVQFAPQQLRYKVYIIDEVHMLSGSAFNALLKTIEEPPSYVVFIFATTEAHKVPATVRSRCQQFGFRQMPLEIITQQLQMATEQLGLTGMSGEVLFWIAKEASGSMRDAYTLFDQIAALEGKGEIDLERVFEVLGKSSNEVIISVAEQLSERAIASAIEKLHQILSSGVAVERFLSDLCDCYRIVLLRLHDIDDRNILGVDNNDSYDRLVAAYRPGDVIAIMDECIALHRNLRTSQQGEQELELCLAKIAYIRDRLTIEELMAQLHSVAGQIDSGEPPASDTDAVVVTQESAPVIAPQQAATESTGAPPASASAEMPAAATDAAAVTQAADTDATATDATATDAAPAVTQTADTDTAPAVTQAADTDATATDATATDAAPAVTQTADTGAAAATDAAPAVTQAADTGAAAEETTSALSENNAPLDAVVMSKICNQIKGEQEQIAAILSHSECFRTAHGVVIYGRDLFECDMLNEQRSFIEEQFSTALQEQIAIDIKMRKTDEPSAKDEEMIIKAQKYFRGDVIQAP